MIATLSADEKLYLLLGIGVFVVVMWFVALYLRDREGL